MESKHRNIKNKNRWMVGGTRDTDSVAKEIGEVIGTIVVFVMMGLLAIVFMAVTTGCGVATKAFTTDIITYDVETRVENVSTFSIHGVPQKVGVPFQMNGKRTVITKAIGKFDEAIFRAENLASKLLMDSPVRTVKRGNTIIQVQSQTMGIRTVYQRFYNHSNGVQIVAVITSQKI